MIEDQIDKEPGPEDGEGMDISGQQEITEPSTAEKRSYGIADKRTLLAGMFRDWYLEYASYVILERAVPHIEDGLKPVQRRILHSMQTLDDGRFNKVANIVGNTMQYHPHGDASIGDALVQLGQKDLLIDHQGNWGNILTGDSAAAPRYIEARLSEFALEAVFSPKVTEWVASYDGRAQEPVTLPVKFPLLLAQGVEGIAVGLSSKILPHNFNEILDAAVAYLKGEEFSLMPDFQTGGYLDASRYNDGARGGSVKVRAKIEKIDSKTLMITEIPFGKTTPGIIASILAAFEKGKIKIRSVDDNTARDAGIVVNLIPGTSSDKAIDALYAFTDCEVSISPNCCVIRDKKPQFLTVSDVLRFSVDRTQDIFRRELEIKLGETRETALFASLEKLFIEERMYKDREIETARDMEVAVAHLDKRFEPFKPDFYRPITNDDLMRLWEIKMARILKFNAEKAEERIMRLNEQIEEIQHDLSHLTEFTIDWFTHLKEKYGDRFPRRTVLRNFDSIVATKVAEANKRFYFDKKGGFVGTALKDGEMLFSCSDLDDIVVFYNTGAYRMMRVQPKLHVGKGVRRVVLFKKGDRRTIYNAIYRNGKGGFWYKKRFALTGLTRDKDYHVSRDPEGSLVKWLSVNPNGEAETVKVVLERGQTDCNGKKPRTLEFLVDFAQLDIRGRDSLGNLVTKYNIEDISLKNKGVSTLGGREVWFDKDVLRLNYDGRGHSLGTFQADDKVLVITKDGEYYTTDYSETNHYGEDILRIQKFDAHQVWTLALYDPQLGYPYLKRFRFEVSSKPQRFVGSDSEARILLLMESEAPLLRVVFGGDDAVRPPLEIDASEFIGVKSFKAKGKRITTFKMVSIEQTGENLPPEPEPIEEPVPEPTRESEEEQEQGPHIVQGNLFD